MSKLSLISWNINGIRAVERKGALDWLDQGEHDVVCFQETKVQDITVLSERLLHPKGYNTYWHSDQEKKGYSGVAVYSKNRPNEVITDFGTNILSKEGRILELHYDEFILLNVYFPNGKMSPERLQYKMDFYEQFLKYITTLDKAGKKVVFCGDVNTAHTEIDLARPKANEKVSGFLPQERAWIDKLIDNGWKDTLRMFTDKPKIYTWWDLKSRARDRNVGWRIDYFFANKVMKSHIKDAFVLADVMGSDHCPVGISVKI